MRKLLINSTPEVKQLRLQCFVDVRKANCEADERILQRRLDVEQ